MSSIPHTMKALVLTRKDEASTPTLTLIRDHPVPTPPPGYLLIRILASAIHPSDILNAQGNFPYTSYPRIPGRDFAGTVVALGPPPPEPEDSSTPPSSDHADENHDGNANSLLGATVFGTSGNTHAFTADGFHAEYAVVPAAGVARVPAGINPAAAATLGVPWTTAGLALERARVRAGETVLVLGANGAVGRAAVSLARAMGCSKVMRGVRGAGGDVDTMTGDALLGRVGEITGGKGVDVVVDAVGSEALTGAAVKMLGKDGRLVFVAGKGELRIDMREFYRMGKSVVGCNSLNETVESMGGRLRSMVASGSFDLLNGESSESGWEKTSLEGAVEAYSKAAADRKRKFVIMM